MSWPPPTISDHYRAALEQAKQELDSTSDDRVLGMDPDKWVDYLVEKFAMTAIELDEARASQLFEEEIEREIRGYDIYSGRSGGTVRITNVKVTVPVVPSDTLREIWKHGLAPNSFAMVKYPEYGYDDRAGTIHASVSADERAVKDVIGKINASIREYNSSIESENRTFRSNVLPHVNGKRARTQEKHSKLDTLAAAVGIPLTKKADPTKVVPTAPTVRQKIAPIMPPATQRQERPVLATDKFAGILELIDNQCRGFERTPQAYAPLSEEGLRDIILGSLNAVFEGAAGGETFQGIGKVDIHLRITQGEVFIAEVKFWGGPKTLDETVTQLLGRLTWRDSYGVAIMLSRNGGFTEVLTEIAQRLPQVEGFVQGTLRKVTENRFAARFSIPSDPKRQVEVVILAYNLYVQQPGKRQKRRI